MQSLKAAKEEAREEATWSSVGNVGILGVQRLIYPLWNKVLLLSHMQMWMVMTEESSEFED